MDPIDPSVFKPLLEEFKKKNIPIYKERENSGVGRTQGIGIYWRRNYGVGYLRCNDKYPRILEEARKLIKILKPDLNYTTIMLNLNYEANLHKDINNDGESLVVAISEYEGGELVVEGTSYNIKYRPVVFHASKLSHLVKPITSGERYSIIFFRQKMPKNFRQQYGENLTYDEIANLIPSRFCETCGHKRPLSQVKIPIAEKSEA